MMMLDHHLFPRQTEPVVTVRARDRDDPATPNGNIAFSIRHGNEARLFRIESVGRPGEGAARIFPNGPLKGHYGNYSLTIEARDKGFPPNSVAAVYSICVLVSRIIPLPPLV